MQYWIDGHNLIGKTPGLSLEDQDDEAKLVRLLKQWAGRERKRQVTVFFDAGLPGGEERSWSGGRVTVIFASVGRTADSLILSRIRQIDRKVGAEYTVITSDQAIIRGVTKQKMGHIYSEVFAAMMRAEANPAPPPPVADDPVVSSDEVAEWLDLFGPVPETPPPPLRRARPASGEPATPQKATSAPLRPRKTDRVRLSPEEVDAWMALFADAPAPPEETTTGPKKEDERGRSASPSPSSPQETTHLPTRKKTVSKLSPDEVEAWMDVFRSGKKK